jgi:hypothetical protein
MLLYVSDLHTSHTNATIVWCRKEKLSRGCRVLWEKEYEF